MVVGGLLAGDCFAALAMTGIASAYGLAMTVPDDDKKVTA
jgi:hypothetical protein